jgi:hypothetical protein
LAITDIPNALVTLAKLTQGADGQVLAAPGGVNTWTPSPTITGTVTAGALLPGAFGGGTPAQHVLYRDNVVKAWVRFTGAAGVIGVSFNVSSITRVAAGTYTVSWTRAFAAASYVVIAIPESASSLYARINGLNAVQAGVLVANSTTGVATDPDWVDVIAIGAQ